MVGSRCEPEHLSKLLNLKLLKTGNITQSIKFFVLKNWMRKEFAPTMELSDIFLGWRREKWGCRRSTSGLQIWCFPIYYGKGSSFYDLVPFFYEGGPRHVSSLIFAQWMREYNTLVGIISVDYFMLSFLQLQCHFITIINYPSMWRRGLKSCLPLSTAWAPSHLHSSRFISLLMKLISQ